MRPQKVWSSCRAGGVIDGQSAGGAAIVVVSISISVINRTSFLIFLIEYSHLETG